MKKEDKKQKKKDIEEKHQDLIKILSFLLFEDAKRSFDNELLLYIEETRPSSTLQESNEEDFLKKAVSSRIVYIGEMHNSKTILKENLRLFTRIYDILKKNNKKFALCLEFVPYNAEIEKYINGEIKLEKLFSQISNIEGILSQERFIGKVFKKENYKDLLKYCKEHKICVRGTDKRDETSLIKRDFFAADIIARTAQEYDCVVVMGGNHHVHPTHLPKIVQKKLSHYNLSSNFSSTYLLTDHESMLHFIEGWYKDERYENLFYRRLVEFREFFNCYFRILEFDKGKKNIFYEDLDKACKKLFNKKLWFEKKDIKYLETIAPIDISFPRIKKKVA